MGHSEVRVYLSVNERAFAQDFLCKEQHALDRDSIEMRIDTWDRRRVSYVGFTADYRD